MFITRVRKITSLSIMPRSVGVTGVFSSASCPTVPCPLLSTMPVAIPIPQSLFSVPEIRILCVHITVHLGLPIADSVPVFYVDRLWRPH